MNRAAFSRLHTCLVALALAASAALASSPDTPATRPAVPDAGVDRPTQTDPLLIDSDPIAQFSPRLLEVWLEALARPDADTRRAAADAIADAHAKGLPGALDRAATPLLKALDAPGQHPLVKLACLHALIAINDRAAAPSLLAHAQTDGLDAVLLVEPALVAWNYLPAREVWLARLQDSQASRQSIISALGSLAAVQEPKLAALARKMVLDPALDSSLRLAAARALSAVSTSNEDDARTLYAAGAPIADRLLAATLLSTARGPAAQQLLLQMARDQEPAVQALPLRRLLDLDVHLLAPLNAELVASADPNVRLLAIEGLLGQQTPEAIAFLARLLDDPNVKARASARQACVALSGQGDLRPVVCRELLAVLAGAQWRALEQAALALGTIDEKAAADRLVILLDADRAEVRLAAAVALRRLGVPATAPAVLDRATRLAHDWKTMDPKLAADPSSHLPEQWDAELAQLLCALGKLRHAPAENLCMQMVPKMSGYGVPSREAACWALGKIHEGTPSPAVAAALAGRARDGAIDKPEATEVRVASTIALGRMHDKGQLGTAQGLLKNEMSPRQVAVAARWAIHELTGQWPPELPEVTSQPSGWFIEPY